MTYIDRADFYRIREHQERSAAARATHPESQRIHLQLADAYLDMMAREVPRDMRVTTVLA